MRCDAAVLRARIPAGVTSWALLRPRAIFEHPRLGRILARAFDDAADEALFSRARRVGYDVRTVDRAALAWTPSSTWSAGLGSFDTRRIEQLLWDRLLPPRARMDENGVAVTEGALNLTPVSLTVWNACGYVSFAEGPAGSRMNALALHPRADAPDDDDALARWHSALVPAELRARAPAALLEGVHDVEVDARLHADGLDVSLRLEGALPADGSDRVRRALDVFIESPLGGSIGAVRWASHDAATIRQEGDSITVRARVPWVSLDAMADVLRGRVGDGPGR